MSPPTSPSTHNSPSHSSPPPQPEWETTPSHHPAYTTNWRQRSSSQPITIINPEKGHSRPFRHYTVKDPDVTDEGQPYSHVGEVQDYLVPGHKDEPWKTRYRGWNPHWADDRVYDDHGVHRRAFMYANSGDVEFVTRYKTTGVVERRWVPAAQYAREVALGLHPAVVEEQGQRWEESTLAEHRGGREEEYEHVQTAQQTEVEAEAEAGASASAPTSAGGPQGLGAAGGDEEDSDSGWLTVSYRRRQDRWSVPVRQNSSRRGRS